MRWWKKTIRTAGKALVVLLVAAFTVLLFFPGLFTKYLQTYANRKYLIPMGLKVSYTGFEGDLFSGFQFQDIRVAARDGAFVARAENAHMDIDFLRLLRRDLSFDQVFIGQLLVEIPTTGLAPMTDTLRIGELPWISIRNLTVENAVITRGDTDLWFRGAGRLDIADRIRLDKVRFELAYSELPDTLHITAPSFTFDGQWLEVLNGDLHYQDSHVALSGKLQVLPETAVDIYVQSDRLPRLGQLPDWIDCYAMEGHLQGNLAALEGQLSLGLKARGIILDQAQVHFGWADDVIRIHRAKLIKGTQYVEVRGEARPGRDLALDVSFSEARPGEFLPGLPEVEVDGEASIQAVWPGIGRDSVQITLALDRLWYQGRTFRGIRAGILVEDSVWAVIDTAMLKFASGDLRLWGSADVASGTLDLEVYLQTDSLASILEVFGWPLLAGRANGQVWVSGSWNDPSLTGAVMLEETRYGQLRVGRALIQFLLDNVAARPQGRLYASMGDLDFMNMLLEGGEAEFVFAGDTVFATTMRLYRGLEKLDTRGYLTFGDSLLVVLDTLSAWRNTETLTAGRIRASRVGDELKILPVAWGVAGGEVMVSGDWINRDNFTLQTSAGQVDMERLYRFFGRPPRFRGVVDARADLRALNGRLAAEGTLDAVDGEFDAIPYTRLHSRFSLGDNRLALQELTWENKGGIAAATGTLTYAHNASSFGGLGRLDSVALQGSLDGFQFHDLQPVLPWIFETYGLVSGSFTAAGSADDPVYTADLMGRSPGFDLITGERLSGQLRYEDLRLEFSNLALKTATGFYTGGGTLPADLRPIGGTLDVIPDAPVDLAFSGSTSQLDFITPYFEDIDSLNGNYEIELALSGTFQNLVRDGRLIAKDSRVELFVMENPIVRVDGEVELVDNLLTVKRLEGHTPRSQRGADESRLTVSGSMDMTQFFTPAFDLQIKGEHAYFLRPLGEIEVVGSPDLSVVGRDTVFFQGEFVPDPDQAFLRMDFTGPESYVLKKRDEGTILAYNIRIPLHSGATVDNAEVNAEVEGELTITKVGSEDYRYAGTINVVSGSFIFNGYEFELDEGQVNLDPSEVNPQFYIRATTQVEVLVQKGPREESGLEQVDVTLVLSGTLKEPQLSFESTALISESDLLQLFALGKGPEEVVDPAVAAGIGLTNMILRRIEEDARRAGLDRFQIQTASTRSIIPDLEGVRIHIGKRLTPRWYVGVQADPTLSDSEAQIAYRLSRIMSPLGPVDQSLVGSVDRDGNYQIKYRLKLRY